MLAFARYRELLGFDQQGFPLPDPPTVAGLLAQPALEGLPTGALVAVNEVMAGPGTPLAPGDRVALMPPVSGG